MSRVQHLNIQCHCRHLDHMIRVTLDAHEDPPELSFQPLLNPNPSLWKRIKIAFRYVFGLPPEEGWGSWHFSDVVLDSESVNSLSTMLTHRRALMKLRAMKKKKDKLQKVSEKGR